MDKTAKKKEVETKELTEFDVVTEANSSSHQSHANLSSTLPYWLGGLAIVSMFIFGAYSYRVLLRE